MLDLDALGALTLLDADEQPHELGALWRDRPLVLAFIRHFG